MIENFLAETTKKLGASVGRETLVYVEVRRISICTVVTLEACWFAIEPDQTIRLM